MAEEKKDVIVVAREGYRILLAVGQQNLVINCYEPINLSNMFSQETLDKCTGLNANLEDGNLVYYIDQDLPKNLNVVKIKLLKETFATKLETNYTQAEETSIPHMRVKTSANITSEMKEDIQIRIVKNKDELLKPEKKMLAKHQNIDVGSSKARMKSLSPEELTMKVQMDISPEEFKTRQLSAKKELDDQNRVNHARVVQEVKDLQESENKQTN